MKHHVSTLEGALLDAAVAKAEGHTATIDGREQVCMYRLDGSCAPSTLWADGGPIIQRERITLLIWEDGTTTAEVSARWDSGELSSEASAQGATALIAAMLAYVASRFGEEVELP